jgi:hypothetical protein
MKVGQRIGQWLKEDIEANGDLIIHKIHFEKPISGYWAKIEWDSQGNQIYYEDSFGQITDYRTPEIIEHNGRKYQLIP